MEPSKCRFCLIWVNMHDMKNEDAHSANSNRSNIKPVIVLIWVSINEDVCNFVYISFYGAVKKKRKTTNRREREREVWLKLSHIRCRWTSCKWMNDWMDAVQLMAPILPRTPFSVTLRIMCCIHSHAHRAFHSCFSAIFHFWW